MKIFSITYTKISNLKIFSLTRKIRYFLQKIYELLTRFVISIDDILLGDN
jgi:hypothetical protein